MRVFVILFFISLSGSTFSQGGQDSFPDVETSFSGGSSALKEFIKKEMEYPELSLVNRDEGRVYVRFVVEADGRITNITVVGEGVTPELNAEAVRIIAAMPRWIPAQSKGEKVRSFCRMPITFTLDTKASRKARKDYKKRKNK